MLFKPTSADTLPELIMGDENEGENVPTEEDNFGYDVATDFDNVEHLWNEFYVDVERIIGKRINHNR